ncbi:MAG TPA: hypothetical protein VNO82_15855, partial [Solirubrobacteraceae bacterium]|nr:hypothetical protein [Solirubrobacteraceae bacterium]
MATTDGPDERRPDAPPAAPGGAAPPRRPSKPSSGWVFAPALGAFFAALTLLAFQVRSGNDPALGPAEPQPVAQVQKKPKRVLIRKVIKRIVV